MRVTLQFRTFDGEYVRLLSEGDSLAGDHFANHFGSVLFLKLRVRLRSIDLIEDVRQATLLRVLQILRQGSGIREPRKLAAFVNSVCENVIREHCRAERRFEAWDSEMEERADPSVDLDAGLVNDERKRMIQDILAALSGKDRRILRALFLEELDKAQLCAEFAAGPAYLRVLQHRAKTHFRAACGERTAAPAVNPA